MYLIDTNVISELRKGQKANNGVRQFFDAAVQNNTPLYISVITVGELRRGVDLIFHRGDTLQAERLFLVPTRCVGMQSQRAALRSRPQRGQYEFPRSAWELGKDFEHTGVSLLNPFDE
jgi:predicted nucleic acid-binding protein